LATRQDVSGLGRLSRTILKVSAELQGLLTLQPAMQSEMESSGLWELFQSLEMPLASVLAGMEVEGVAVNSRLMQSMGNVLYVLLFALIAYCICI